MSERFIPPRKSPRPSYAGKVAIKRLVEAAKAAGIDVAGIEAAPDGTIRVVEARTQAKPTLFDELERKGQL